MINFNELIEQGLVQNYSNKLSKAQIGGSSMKKFIRVHNSIFGDLWDKIELGKVSYNTYINDAVKAGDRPEYVSCLLKKIRNPLYAQIHINRELATMILANMLHIPCEYTMPVNYNDKLYSINVDFVPYDYKVKTLTELIGGDFIDGDAPIEEYQEKIYNPLFKANKHIPNENKFDYVNNQVASIIEQVFFKKYILGDGDCCSDNLAVLVSKENTIPAPVFDKEFSFSNASDMSNANINIIEDMDYMLKHYPQVINKFIDFADKALNNGFDKIKKELSKSIKDKDFIDKTILFLAYMFSNITAAHRIAIAKDNNFSDFQA